MSDLLTGSISAALEIGAEVLITKKRGFANLGNPGGGTGTTNDISFSAQIVENERHHDSVVVTSHPVQMGAEVSDHAYKLPAEVTLRYGWSNSPKQSLAAQTAGIGASLIGGGSIGQAAAAGFGIGASAQVNEVYDFLLGLHSAKTLFDLYTGKRLYSNMLIQDLDTETDYTTENAMVVTIHCKQLIIARTQIISFGVDAQKGSKQPVQR
jgi:hypothetical protein